MQQSMAIPGLIVLPSGKLFDLLNPTEDDFDIMDIAHTLALSCRWGGWCREFYSVAQHSFYASYMVQPRLALAALLHDATEAYMTDIPRPLKALLPDYCAMETTLGGKLAVAFDLPVCAFVDPEIKAIDDRLMALEATVLINTSEAFWQTMGGRPDGSIFDIDKNFQTWPWEVAEKAFLSRYFEIRSEGHIV